MSGKDKSGGFVGFKWKKRRTCLVLGFFETKRLRGKKGKGQTCPLYRATRKSSLTIRLKLLAIDDHDCFINMMAEIRRLFEF